MCYNNPNGKACQLVGSLLSVLYPYIYLLKGKAGGWAVGRSGGGTVDRT